MARLIFFAISLLSLFLPALAEVDKIAMAEDNMIPDLACNIFLMTQSVFGRSIAVFVVVITGGGFLLGKGSWGILISLSIGIILMFSATEIVAIFVGDKGVGGCYCRVEGDGEHCPQK